MRYVKGFGLFWWDFVVGDDWRVAVGLAVAIAIVALLAHETDVTSWWLLPLAVAGLLYASLRRAAR